MKKDDKFNESEKEQELSQDELTMLRSRYDQLGDDRSKIPPPNKKEDSKFLRLIKKNKLATAVLAVLAVALTVSIVLLCVYSANSGERKNTKDYTFFFGKEEISYKNEKIVINNELYVDMNRLAVYAELSCSGSSTTMKYIASEGQYVKFTNESEYAVINGTKVVIPSPVFADEQKCLVPYSIVSHIFASGIDVTLNEKENTVTVKRQTYTQDDVEYFKDITFTSAYFKSVSALKDTSNVAFEYPIDVSNYLNYIISSDALLLVNQQFPLSKTYIPNDLYKLPSRYTALDENYYLREDAAHSLIAMMKAMPNYQIYVTSAYRDYYYQETIFEQYVKSYIDKGYTREQAEVEVLKTSARPGTSEHQSGLCIDFILEGMSSLNNSFENSAAFEWLSNNAYKYGFILRYPKDKTDITCYNYESWHYRFVGREAATQIYFSGLCLEEYLELI